MFRSFDCGILFTSLFLSLSLYVADVVVSALTHSMWTTEYAVCEA